MLPDGVNIQGDMKWGSHVNTITNKTVGFLWRNH